MYYVIDMDSLKVESKSEDGELLASYISDNDLDLAVVLIHSEEELVLQLSLTELKGVYGGLNGNPPKWSDEEHAARDVWITLGDHDNTFPKFTKALGKRLLKQASKPAPERPATTNKAKPKTTSRVTVKSIADKSFSCTSKLARKGTVIAILQDCIEDNLGEISFTELKDSFMFEKDCTDKYANEYICGSVREGYIEIVEEL